MNEHQAISVAAISGPAGVGKSAAAFELSLRLERAGVAHALIDTDELDRISPTPSDLERLSERNLAAVWSGFAERGSRRLILVGVWLDQPHVLASLQRAISGADFTLIRLVASQASLLDRVANREIGSGAAAQIQRTLAQLRAMAADERPGVRTLDVERLTVIETAAAIEGLLEWETAAAPRDLHGSIQIGDLRPDDPPVISAAFAAIGWTKPIAQYERYLEEQVVGTRAVLVARSDDAFAGYVTVLWESDHRDFATGGIPEIQDLNVLPPYRRRGVGTRLLDEAEALVATRSAAVGIGFGLSWDYGPAQRLYARRGYVPDGKGIVTAHVRVEPGQTVRVDDDLVLYLTKRLR